MSEPYAHIVVSECLDCSKEADEYVKDAEKWFRSHNVRYGVIRPGTHMYYWLMDKGHR